MTKAELRRMFLDRRSTLTSNEVKRRSQLVAWHFFKYVEQEKLLDSPAFLLSFLPIRRHNEVNTWWIINAIWAKSGHISISVPVMDTASRQFTPYSIHPDTPLIENRLGIPEPQPDHRQLTDIQLIAATLVPLLAFDEQGNRIGYGGGYYDRFLARCPPDCRKIGLSLFEPTGLIESIEPTDVRLDACITPYGSYIFA